MNYDEKTMLIGTCKEELEEFRTRLKQSFCISSKLKKYLNNYLLVVNCESDYNLGLIYANQVHGNLLLNTKLVNLANKIKELGKVEICQVAISHENQDLPETELFLEGLREKLHKKLGIPVYLEKEDSNIYIYYKFHVEYHRLRGKFVEEFHSASWFVDERIYEISCLAIPMYIKKVVSAVNSFMKSDVYKNNSHVLNEALLNSIECLDFYGNRIQTQMCKKRHENMNLLNFITESALMKGIKYPLGSNLSPKPLEKEKNPSGKYFSSSTDYNAQFVNRKAQDGKNGINVVDEYKTCFSEWYRPVKELGRICVPFKMEDTLKIFHDARILSNTKLVVKSYVTVKREVSGEKLDSKPTVYDALYQNNDYKDGEFDFTVTDYYEIIDLNTLLHYTDASKFYKVYEIPLGYKFEDGLFDLDSTLYDYKSDDWICYDKISEVKKALLK